MLQLIFSTYIKRKCCEFLFGDSQVSSIWKINLIGKLWAHSKIHNSNSRWAAEYAACARDNKPQPSTNFWNAFDMIWLGLWLKIRFNEFLGLELQRSLGGFLDNLCLVVSWPTEIHKRVLPHSSNISTRPTSRAQFYHIVQFSQLSAVKSQLN
jgi:hypothetical protein